MNIFSFRADCIQDVFDLTLSPGMKAIQRLTIHPDQAFPDVEVELVTVTTEAELRRVIAALDDAHVIEDTLRSCDLRSNPLQRSDDPDVLPRLPEF